jgi:putative endonuclease
MLSHNSSVGKFGEIISKGYLLKIGYEILKTNYKCKIGEIDIITCTNKTIIFTEVKTRTTLSFGYPEEAVNYIKIQKIKRVANNFIISNHLEDFEIRFDVISLKLNNMLFSGKEEKILLEENKLLLQEYIKNNDPEIIRNKFHLEHITYAF